jgi:hypothetical protein
MAKKLTRLKIDEISLVDRGAGEGVRVMLSKRRDRPSINEQRWATMFRREVDFSKIHEPPVDDIVDDDNGDVTDGKLSPQLEQHINALIVAVPGTSRSQAANFLLRTAHGRGLLRTLATVKSTTNKETPMDRATELQSIVKSHGGIQAMAKLFVAANKSIGNVTEFEFSKLIDDAAQLTRQAGERPDQAFSRFYSAPESLELRKAIQLCKSVPAPRVSVDPVVVDEDEDVSDEDCAKAYEKLQALAADLRASKPELSEAQAFSKVFTDPKNISIARVAHRRPTA